MENVTRLEVTFQVGMLGVIQASLTVPSNQFAFQKQRFFIKTNGL